MRLIDADKLEIRVDEFEKMTGMKLDIVHDFVSSAPTAQPTAESIITRCKDCKHYDNRPCGIVDYYNTASDFCSRAERRTDE